ncbi:N-acetyltransferase family protein [Dactylosporangium sp. CA-092794]|uniref:GNAT family N-acetyltransferase n=1 Tax=Dactylosporangium sp. CA-092794 TaxID=3239929 RepID=UPI003D94AC09
MTETPLLTTEHLNQQGMRQQREDLLDVYSKVYQDSLSDPFFSVERYWERLEAYASRDGFSLVLGRVNGRLIGYTLGYTLPKGSGWWRGLEAGVPSEFLEEDGRRTFALNEIMVLAEHRRKGYARILHDALLSGRAELRATLLVLPNNTPARTAYFSWGWEMVGQLRPFDDAPTYDSLILDLTSWRAIPVADQHSS